MSNQPSEEMEQALSMIDTIVHDTAGLKLGAGICEPLTGDEFDGTPDDYIVSYLPAVAAGVYRALRDDHPDETDEAVLASITATMCIGRAINATLSAAHRRITETFGSTVHAVPDSWCPILPGDDIQHHVVRVNPDDPESTIKQINDLGNGIIAVAEAEQILRDAEDK